MLKKLRWKFILVITALLGGMLADFGVNLFSEEELH